MKFQIEKTKNDNEKIIVELDTGAIFKGYLIGKKFQFSHNQTHVCYLNKQDAKRVFKKANDIAVYGGNPVEYLKADTKRTGMQTEVSQDGLYKFRFYSRNDKGGIRISAFYEGRERLIRPVLPLGEIDKAKQIIKEICKEYDDTGRFKSERNSLRGTPFPHEYFDESKEENLNLAPQVYNSMSSYILNGFDAKGNSLLGPGETLCLYCVDGFEIGLEDTDS